VTDQKEGEPIGEVRATRFSKRLARLDKHPHGLMHSFRSSFEGTGVGCQHQGSGPVWHGAGFSPGVNRVCAVWSEFRCQATVVRTTPPYVLITTRAGPGELKPHRCTGNRRDAGGGKICRQGLKAHPMAGKHRELMKQCKAEYRAYKNARAARCSKRV